MSKKQKTLEGCKFLIDKYENYDDDYIYFSVRYCPFCKIYFNVLHLCKGCFMTNSYGGSGCTLFLTAEKAQFGYQNYLAELDDETFSKMIHSFQERAAFFRKVIPILESWPEERFTRKGWKYSGEEIPRTW